MKSKSIPSVRLLLAVLTLIAFGAVPLKIHAASSTIFDTFDVNEGHFNVHPTYSGSTAGILTTSTADRVTPPETTTIEGAGCERLVLYSAGTSGPRVRFLSALGSPGGNVAFNTSSATDGWIGCFVKTTNANWNVQLWLEGASVNGGVPKNIIADGEWHVYEWNLDDNSGGANGWGSIAGLVSGSATMSDGSHTIDSVVFRNSGVPDATSVIYMDFVARYSDGTISNLVDQPCLATPAVGINGPLSTNENIVRVTGVSSSATAITIYQNAGTGFTNTHSLAVSSPAATVNVTVPAGKLIKGALVGATQTIAGQESCTPTTGVAVGGGPSPAIKIAPSIAQPGGLTGPVGAPGAGANAMYWLHATGGAVAGGLTISPSTNWQTIAFYPTDNKYLWNGVFTFPDPNQFGTFEGFGIAEGDTTDSGPMQIYFDNFRQVTNGTEVVIQDFEGNASGTATVLLSTPRGATTTQGNLHTSPNASTISSTVAGGYASTGTNSLGINFQFISASSSAWLRLLGSGANGAPATPSPQLDLTQPILVDVLLLPVGKTVAHPLGRISPLNTYQESVCPNSPVTLAVQVTPPDGTTPTYTYQWRRNNSNISGATASSYNIASATAANSGTYTVIVSDGTASTTVRSTILSVPTAVQIDTQPADQTYVVDTGGSANFSATVSIPANCPCANSPAIGWRWRLNGVPLNDGANVFGATGSGDGQQFPSLTLINVDYSFAGDYTLVVTNLCSGQTVTSSSAKMWVTPHPAISVTCAQQGLLDLDYTNVVYTSAFNGAPAGTNAIMGIPFAPVDYDWSTNIPFANNTGQFPTATDYYALRFVGTFQPPYDPGSGQLYTFYTRSDDGNRLWVNGQLVIDQWVLQGATTKSGSIMLTTNSPVSIILEYFEQTGGSSVQLAYSSPSIMSNTIPMSQLCPAVPGQTGGGGIPPRITLSSPANPTTVTNASSISLSAAVTQEDAAINSVQFFDGVTAISGAIATPPYSATWSSPGIGVHTVTARLTYNGTETLNTPVATVTNYPAAPTAGNNGPITVGQTLQLTASSVAGGTYAWTGPNGFTSTAQNPSIVNATIAASGTYSVKVTVNGLTSAAGTTTAVVNAPSKTPVTITSVVNNGNGTITINYSGGAGASFTLMKSSSPTLARDSWTAVTPDQPATPGSFTITPAGKEFYTVRSN